MAKAKAASPGSANIYDQLPPQAIELEKAVLGVCLLEENSFEVANEIITSQDVFYYGPHKVIYNTLQSMFMRRKSIDLLTVIEELQGINQLEAAGGALYVTQLTNDVVGSAHLEEYCLNVQQKYISRKIIEE